MGFLEEDEVRAVFSDEGRKAAKVMAAVAIQGKKGKDGGRSLPIISFVKGRHLGWSQRCAEKD
jgi:hypothetical protein